MTDPDAEFWQMALAHLRHHWGDAYAIEYDEQERVWAAVRKPGGVPLIAAGPGELREMIRKDYGPPPADTGSL